MRFSVGLWDSIFGEKVDVELHTPSGTAWRRVSKAWLEKAAAEGALRGPNESEPAASPVKMFVVGPDGLEAFEMTIGEDISFEDYKQFSHAGAIYALATYENGEKSIHIVQKAFWDEARRQLDAIG